MVMLVVVISHTVRSYVVRTFLAILTVVQKPKV